MTLEFKIISTIIYNMIDIYLCYRLLNHTLTLRFPKKWILPVYFAIYGIYTGLHIAQETLSSNLFKLSATVFLYAALVLIHSGSLGKRFLWVAGTYLSLALCELIAIPITCFFTHTPFEEIPVTPLPNCIGMTISQILFFLFQTILIRSQYEKKKLFEGFSKEIAVIVLIDFIYLMIIANLFYYNAMVLDVDTAIILSIFVLVLISALSIYLLQKVVKKSEEIMNTNLRLQQAEMEQKLTSDISSVVEDLRSLRHDMNNHMSVLQGLLSVKAYDEVDTYLNSITQELTVANSFYFPENKVLSVLVNSKISKASQLGIPFETDIRTSKTPFSERDLCTLIGNILENAIEAATGHQDPYIYFAMYQNKNQLHIQCDNTYIIEPIFENGKLLTTKENKTTHGIGTQNIRSVAEAYEGTVQFFVDDQFHVEVSIPL